MNINVNNLLGTHDILLVTIDSLRFDVAETALMNGSTPELARYIPGKKWEKRYTPGSFTYSAHHAFFSGFFPTPTTEGPHQRLFAVTFPGSESITDETCVFNEQTIVAGLANRGYHTVCIGGVGFFNKQSPLGSVLPKMFAESYWSEDCGVTNPESTRNQVDISLEIISRLEQHQRLFLFINISSTHQPSCIFIPGAQEDTEETQIAALAHADTHIGRLLQRMQERAPLLVILFSDHGTAFGEGGYHGHRLGHSVVWTVPYAHFVLPGNG